MWNSEPSSGGPIGQVCIVGGTQDWPTNIMTTETIDPNTTVVTLNTVTGLIPRQNITIGDGADTYQIVLVRQATIEIAPPALTDVDDGATLFFTDGTNTGVQTAGAVSAGNTTVMVSTADGLISGQNVKIGAGADVYLIVNITPPMVDITPGTFVGWPANSPVAFSIPIATPVNIGDTQMELSTLLLNNVEELDPGQYITIGDEADVYKIMRTARTIDISPKVGEVKVTLPDGTIEDQGVPSDTIVIVNGLNLGVKTLEAVSEGDTAITLNTVDGLMSGQNVTLGDKPDVYTIMKVHPAVINIESTQGPAGAHAVVPVGKTIAFSPATFSSFGEIVNIGNSTSYPIDKLLEPTDRYVTVTVPGKTMTLPAFPVSGQTHSIKCKSGVTTTVQTADGISIDGALTVVVESLENRTFRYNAATGEWEIW